MRKIIILLVLWVGVTSCVTEKRCNRKFPNVTHDSIYINTVTTIHDTTVYYQVIADTIEAVTPDSEISVLTNKYCYTTAQWKSGLLYHKLFTTAQDLPVTVEIKYVDRVEYRDRTVIKEVKYTPKWVQYLATFGVFSFIGLVGIALILFKK